MFCKWCGGNLAPSETKCKRCGKEIPALSDCGGFYDLVPTAKTRKTTPDDMVGPNNGANQQRGDSGKDRKQEAVEKAPVKKKNNKQPLFILGLITLCCFAILFVQILLLNGKIGKQTESMSNIKEELQGMATQLQELSKEETTPLPTLPEEKPNTPTESPAPTEPELKKQDISFGVTITTTEDLNEYFAHSDLGDYVDSVSVAYEFDKVTGEMSTAYFTLKEVEGTVELNLSQTIEFRSHKVLISYAVDDKVFGITDKPAEFKWMYRINNSEEWAVVPASSFNVESGEGETAISIKTTELLKLADADSELLELRCEILLENADGGSLTLVIEGITLSTIGTEGIG